MNKNKKTKVQYVHRIDIKSSRSRLSGCVIGWLVQSILEGSEESLSHLRFRRAALRVVALDHGYLNTFVPFQQLLVIDLAPEAH